MNEIWYVEILLSDASGWVEHVDDLMEALKPLSGTLGSHPEADLSVRVTVEATDAFKAVTTACGPVMEALISQGIDAVIRSTEVLTEAEMDAFLAG
jgi:hypothetical protein